MSSVQAGKWPRIALGEIAVKRRGSVDPQKYPDETFELYSIPAYDAGQPEIVRGVEIGSSKQLLEPDDVVISRIVPHIQRVWIVGPKNAYRLIGSGEWIPYRSKRFLPQYLRHTLLSPPFHASFMSTVAGVGGSLLRARPSALAEIEVSCPPLDEQRRIAVILDKADAIRRKRQQAIALADDFLRSAFLDMFGDPVVNARKWPVVALGDVLSNIDSGFSPRCQDRAALLDEWGVLKLSAVTSTVFRSSESKAVASLDDVDPRHEVRPGDLLFSRKNTYQLVGAAALVEQCPSKLLLPDLIFRLQTKSNEQIHKPFLWAQLTHPGVRERIRGLANGAAGSMPNISKAKLLDLPIVVPAIGLQRRFSELYARVQSTKRGAAVLAVQSDTLFASLSQRAFRGEL
ncbi:restriction endonuclease subunit S [Magnetospirillum molischianum]|uniref:Type I restriction-modification system, S subunit n=1 Tax=Magnetospirillum molischianum DSM 120 TaxID=1150626 RepID=H8FPY3_MAGML|nr:restriction endonuclease subunit S [Magnetospirillum molischianum]CCG40421.1 Type I restriction-modification system, S subunit [Magnetospirillum molischianum DSM 120]